MDNLEIIARCKEGDPIAWEDFIKTFGPLAQKIVRRYFSLALDDVENITQNMFVKLYEGGIGRFRGTNLYQFRAYLKTIALNETKTYLQKENRWKDKIEDLSFTSDEMGENSPLIQNSLENIEAQSPRPDQIAEGKETTQIVDHILQNFSLKDRQLFLLKLKGYKEKEISEIIGIPMGSVASSYSRMVDKIQEALRKKDRL